MSRFFGEKPLEDDVARARIYGGQPVCLNPAATSTSWDSDGKAVGTTSVDTSALFGLPAGVKSVNVRLGARWAVAAPGTSYAYCGPKGGAATCIKAVNRAWAANVYDSADAWVPCDANGDIDVVVVGADTTGTYLEIAGYTQ